ncbi:alpha/beta hydrolase [Synechococcus sp. CCY9201]|uniref:alpha/beta fold hydrolase n=1 Tax=unclassified Synechococcus TaxID=2626047 RepID=UPI002AD301AF|nr:MULTISPECIES: alpha/beta hydrolase [unclassified Synechococcus]MEA5474053.1 alpha/beta hydrolase [Synechococcus sp. CCY9201]CAK6701915.1 Putative aminoacrylate hydrolase RutD [Synechococcus sp. CBW1107]
MSTSIPLRRPGLLDRAITSALLLITPEYRRVRRAQQQNGLGLSPTLPEPAAMPLDTIPLLGEQIRIARQQRPGAPTVLLICPLPQSLLAFAPIWPALAERFDLVAVDLPGFGRSSGGLEWMSFAAQGRFVAALIDHLQLQRPHLVGPDIGMAAAIACVAEHPTIAASLVLGDGPAIAPSCNGSIINKLVDSGFWRFMVTMAGAGTFVEVGNRLACVNYVPNAVEVDDYIRSYAGRVGAICRWFRDYPASLGSTDPALAGLDLPVQLFWGRHDALLLEQNADQLLQRLPRAQLQLLENAGHYSYQDAASEFSAMVIRWVETDHLRL